MPIPGGGYRGMSCRWGLLRGVPIPWSLGRGKRQGGGARHCGTGNQSVWGGGCLWGAAGPGGQQAPTRWGAVAWGGPDRAAPGAAATLPPAAGPGRAMQDGAGGWVEGGCRRVWPPAAGAPLPSSRDGRCRGGGGQWERRRRRGPGAPRPRLPFRGAAGGRRHTAFRTGPGIALHRHRPRYRHRPHRAHGGRRARPHITGVAQPRQYPRHAGRALPLCAAAAAAAPRRPPQAAARGKRRASPAAAGELRAGDGGERVRRAQRDGGGARGPSEYPGVSWLGTRSLPRHRGCWRGPSLAAHGAWPQRDVPPPGRGSPSLLPG